MPWWVIVLSVVVGTRSQQATSYQSIRASHGQGYPTYSSDGSWSQTFGGGTRTYHPTFRRVSPFLGHPAFGPSPAHFGIFNPRPLAIATPQVFDPPASFPTPVYDAPAGNYIPQFEPQYSPEPPTYGDDRLPNYSEPPVSDTPEQIPEATPTPFAEPTTAPVEGRTDYAEGQASFPRAGSEPPQDGRSVSYQSQSNYNEGNYQNYDQPAAQGPTTAPQEYREPSPDYNRAPSPDYNRAPSPDYNRGPSPDYNRDPSPDYNRGPSPDYTDRGPTDYPPQDYPQNDRPSQYYTPAQRDYPNGPSQGYTPQYSGPQSGYSKAPEVGPTSDYTPRPLGRDYDTPGPTVAPRESYSGPSTPSYTPEARNPGGRYGAEPYDRRSQGLAEELKQYTKPAAPHFQNTGPQTFSPTPSRAPLASPPPQNGFKPVYPATRGPTKAQSPLPRQGGTPLKPAAKGRKPVFSGEDAGSFETDFKSTELGSQSFESDLPGFTNSDESYFNSQEGYGSIEGKPGFNSDERKGNSFETDKNFQASYESNEKEPRGGFNPPRGRLEEKKFDLEDKKFPLKKSSEEIDKNSSLGSSESRAGDSAGVAYTGDPTISRPFSGPATSRPYPLYPDKRASFAVEKFLPFDKGYSVPPNYRRSFPSSVETFPAKVTRLYKRKPTGERLTSFQIDKSEDLSSSLEVPVKKKKTRRSD